MMVRIIITAIIIILGVGFYFWRKPSSRAARLLVAGLTLATCAVLWLVSFSPNAPMKPDGTDDVSRPRALSQSQKTITAPAGGTKAPAEPAAQPAPDKTTARASAAKTTPDRVKDAAAPVSGPVEADTTDTATETGSIVAKVNDKQLDALIADAIPVNLEGSTMVNTIVKKGAIQAAARDTPSDDDYAFPEVVETQDGLVMIIPDDPLPSQSSRRQLTTGVDDIPGPDDVVALSYDMFSWSTGEMVESSQTALKGPLMYRLSGKDTPVGIPEYLTESIRNRPYGSTVQVIFEKGMRDLPMYLNRDDGYVLVVRVDKPEMDDESALESMIEAIKQ